MSLAAAKPIFFWAPIVKGITMAILLYAVDVSFVKSVIVATISAVISGTFLLVATMITLRETRNNRAEIRDVKRKIDADKRESDQP